MRSSYRRYLIAAVSGMYLLIMYLLYHVYIRADMATFYAAASEYKVHRTPYHALYSSFAPIKSILSVNLTPPIFLEVIRPLALLSYESASVVWLLLSLALGVKAMMLTTSIIFNNAQKKQYQASVVLIYLVCFATLQNFCIGQLGNVLFFFIVAGYSCYLKNKDYAAGILWGLIIAIKLFPGLLVFYSFRNKRYRLLLTIIVTFCVAWSIPLLTHGIDIYKEYFWLIGKVTWYGDNWNASINGFLYRLIDVKFLDSSVLYLRLAYFCIFTSGLVLFLRTLYRDKKPAFQHYNFCLTIVAMMLLSPLGWLYYFCVLSFPLLALYHYLFIENQPNCKSVAAWCGSFFLINFPQAYHVVSGTVALKTLLGFNSFYFYGLVSLLVLLIKANKLIEMDERYWVAKTSLLRVVFIILAFGGSLILYQLFGVVVLQLLTH